jgi:hypothetical protein
MEMQQLIQQAAKDPRFQQALQVAQAELSDASPEQVEELIELFELMLQRPDDYQAILQAAIQDDMVEPEDMPPEFDATVIASALVVLYKLREGGGQATQMFARGGLAGMRTLARQGRMGDTMMAHVSPEEAAMLKARGGAGTINPQTGYPQYFSLKKLFKAILPIALNFVAPGLGAAIGGAVGLSGAAATAFGGAVIGGASSALTGGNALQGALMGGLGGGLGNVVGGAANKMLGLNLGDTGRALLGSGLVGGAAGAATGQGFLKGLGQGVLGGAVGQLTGGMSGPTAFQQGLGAAGQTFGQALTAGYDPKSALAAGALSGLAKGISYSPADAAVTSLRGGQQPEASANQPAAADAQPTFLQRIFGGGGGDAAGGAGSGSFGTLGKLALAGSALSGLFSAPPEVKQAASTLSPEQQEYFNRPSITWDWNKMQNDANASGMSLSQFMATNWNNITGGQYNAAPAAPAQNPAAMPANAMPAMAHGGRHMMANGGSPLSAVARFARGAGTGRSDEIDAKLSDGEYVIDAETVAMLGDGSSKAGAQRLDQMREKIRSHKGKALAKGKFSPDAKSPLAYIKGVA